MTELSSTQFLPKPPRSDAKGQYNPRELDKFFQVLYTMLQRGNVPTMEAAIAELQSAPRPIAIGGVYISTIPGNPVDLLGYGVWAAFGTGKVLIGIDPADSDFDTVAETGGAKTHRHNVDVPVTTSGAPSATVKVVTAAGVTDVGDGTHTHDTDPAAFDSALASSLPPYVVCFFWQRIE